MSGRGRPLRFLAIVGTGWVAARAAMLVPAVPVVVVPLTEEVPSGTPQALVATLAPPVAAPPPLSEKPARRWVPPAIAAVPASPAFQPLAAPPPILIDRPVAAYREILTPVGTSPAQVSLPPLDSRWSASAWLVARPGSGVGAAPGGQLGGSQAGVRLSYLLDRRQRIGAFARITAPRSGRGKEAAVGVEWQPLRAPVRLVAERRFGLDDIPGGTGVGIVAGVDTSLPAGFRLEAYGQSGAIYRDRIEPYADGSARVTRRLVSIGGADLALGGGVWGGAQRGASRLDLGPSVSVSVKSLRLSLDWRQRVAGDALPGSGPALTLGSDF